MPDLSSASVAELLAALRHLKQRVVHEAGEILSGWEARFTIGKIESSARNLAAYLALRKHDLSSVQAGLSGHGLSSLGRSESRVLESLNALERVLSALAGEAPYIRPQSFKEFFAGDREIAARTRSMFGPDPAGPQTRIMVTLPAEAADDGALISDLVTSGVDAFRINCAHDSPDVWKRTIDWIRLAERTHDRRLPIMMDLAGPKCRLEHIRRQKKRLFVGDRIHVTSGDLPDHSEEVALVATISLPEVITQVRAGNQVWIDDGRIGGRIEKAGQTSLDCIITHADPDGEKLKEGKGINFPDSQLLIDPLTERDLRNLDFVAEHADIVGYSFVQRVTDIDRLDAELAARGDRASGLSVALKIETRLALRNLPDLMMASASQRSTTVMIARGDLGVEVGFERLSEIQEQILWLCHAAHLPVIWATQVAESFVKHGKPIRGEVTDVAMAQRAECVMLNKGPHIVSGAQFVDNILRRMDAHQFKKSPRLSPINDWTSPDTD